jgi:hypothetical protein
MAMVQSGRIASIKISGDTFGTSILYARVSGQLLIKKVS